MTSGLRVDLYVVIQYLALSFRLYAARPALFRPQHPRFPRAAARSA